MDTTETRGSWRSYLASCRAMTERDRRNARTANWALALWCVTFLPALFLLRRGSVQGGLASYALAIVPSVLAIVAVLTYIRFLRQADELHRKIQFEALAFGFGAGFVASFGMVLLEEAGLGTFDAGDPFAVMLSCYVVGLFLGTRRYA